MEHKLAFCLYGNFIWPPNPTKPSDRRESGCVTVRFVDPEKNGHYQIWLAWIPKKKLPESTGDFPGPESDELDTKLILSECEPKGSDSWTVWKKFGDGSKCVSLLLDTDTGRNFEDEVVRFAGSFLIDIFDIANEQCGDISPERRIPLVSEYGSSIDGRKPSSGLSVSAIDIDPGPSVKNRRMLVLELALPTPLQQTPAPSEYQNEAVFPFRIAYKMLGTWQEEHKSNPMNFAALELGAIKNVSPAKHVPNDRRLGYFGFTPVGNPDGFVTFHNPIGSQNCNSDDVKYWPDFWPLQYKEHSPNRVAVALAHLRAFGLDVPNSDTKGFLTNFKCSPTQEYEVSEKNLSIIFSKPHDQSSHAGSDKREFIRYRLRHYALDNANSRALGPVIHGLKYSDKKSFLIGVGEELGGWLDTGTNSILFEAELSWEAGSSDVGFIRDSIFNDYDKLNELLKPKITAKLSWDEPVNGNYGDEFEEYKAVENTVYRFGGLEQAFRSLRSGRRAVEHIENQQPHSLLPELRPSGISKTVRFELANRFCLPAILEKDGLKWGGLANSAFWLTLAKPDDLDKDKPVALPVEALFPTFDYRDTELRPGHALVLTRDESRLVPNPGELPRFASFRIKNAETSKRKLQGQLGGLRFHYQGGKLLEDDTNQYSKLEISRFSRKAIDGVKEVAGPVGLRARLLINIDSIQPIGIDIPRGVTADKKPPILIDLTESGTTTKKPDSQGGARSEEKPAAYLLEIREELIAHADRNFTVRLKERSGNNAPSRSSYLVLSQQPFGLLRFNRTPLQGSEASTEIASYDGLSREWQFLKSSDEYRYALPAQAIGEDADKPRRNEIHDFPSSNNNGNVHPPYPDDKDPVATYLVCHRMVPAAELWIKPSDLNRNQVRPEWAADEIFRGQNDFGPGVALKGFRGEFLYGLSVGINTDLETGGAEAARVAEIEALTGLMLEYVEHDTYTPLTKRWSKVVEMLRHRPYRLELWQLDPTSTRPFKPARFSKGVSFALRNTALHRPPVPVLKPEPVDPQAPKSVLVEPKSLKADGPRYHERGLSGGALWPLESRNFFEALLRNPESNGGSIENIALSPCGGDADQIAEFSNGLVKIISTTRGGLVVRQVVEIKGRIGALWHRAKHVVVYEMTVNASPQFGSGACVAINGQDRADSRTRRPLLRKVEEYVELLETVRSYPDFDSVSPKTTGFLDSVRFNSTIIHVDSAWSEDVGKDGWRIPLWNRHSAKVRPRIYPRPDISFVTVGEGQGERPLIAQECLDPDLLCFYSRLDAGQNTNAWVPLQAIDYANVFDAGSIVQAQNDAKNKAQTDNPDEKNRRSQNANRFLPGYRRFSWRLAPAAAKTRINAERGQKPLYSGLESVTFMRADFKVDIELTKLINKFIPQLRDDLGPSVYWDANGRGAPEFNGLTLAQDLAALRAAVETKDKSEAIARLEAISNAFMKDDGSGIDTGKIDTIAKSIIGDETSHLAKKLGSVKGRFDQVEENIKKVSELNSVIENGEGQCKRIADDAVGGIKRKRRLIAERVRAYKATISSDNTTGKTKAVFADEWENAIVADIKELFEGATTDFGNIENGIETARDVVRDLQQDIDNAIRRGRERVDIVVVSFDQSKPWNESRLEEFTGKLQTELDGIWRDVEAAINELRQRLVTELDEAGQLAATGIGIAASQAVSISLGWLNKANWAETAIRNLGATAEDILSRFYDKNPTVGLYHALRSKLEEIKKKTSDDGHEAVVKIIDKVLAKLYGIKNDVDSAGQELANFISEGANTLSEIQKNIDGLKLEINKLNKVILKQRGELISLLHELNNALKGLPDDNYDVFIQYLNGIEKAVVEALNENIVDVISEFAAEAKSIKEDLRKQAAYIAKQVSAYLHFIADDVQHISDSLLEQADEVLAGIDERIKAVREEFLRHVNNERKHGILLELMRVKAIRPAIDHVLAPFNDKDFDQEIAGKVFDALDNLADEVETLTENLSSNALLRIDDIQTKCSDLGRTLKNIRDGFNKKLETIRHDLEKTSRDKLNELLGDGDELKNLKERLEGDWQDANQILKDVKVFDNNLRRAANDVAATIEGARTYGDRVFDQVAKVGKGGVGAVPGNILRLHAAATSSPEIALLKSNVDRITATFRDTEDLIRTSKAKALFDRFGDALKAMGIDLPFDQLADQFKIDTKAPQNMKLPDLLGNFGGLRLDSGLFDGVSLPDKIDDHVKISHDFDSKQSRAWLRIDVNVPLTGRAKLFELGPVVCSYHDTLLKGFVFLEASADADGLQKQEDAAIHTAIDFAAAGQQLVTLEQVTIRYSKQGNLDFDFNPKYIRINKVFQFVQDTLGTLFPGEFGGMTVVKERGIPVGLEHEFAMPPMSLNFGTSGITNIGISNRFRLLAYPEFMISDRFNLSRREQPFIFSIFILGGTGYIQIDTEYKPSDKSLSVMVEAAAGASAALAFAFGPVAGGVFITLSVALGYQKVIGRPGGGMTVSLVLVMGGGVSLWGIAHVYLVLVLSLAYRSSGQIDASGDLRAEVRICKWVKLKFRGTVTYKLRNGQASKQVTSSTSAKPGEKVKALKNKAERLRGVRS